MGSVGEVDAAEVLEDGSGEDFGVVLGGGELLMSEEVLDGGYRYAVMHQAGGTGVARGVEGDALADGGVGGEVVTKVLVGRAVARQTGEGVDASVLADEREGLAAEELREGETDL